MDTFRSRRVSLIVTAGVLAICSCSKNPDIQFGVTTVDSVIAAETRKHPSSAPVLANWPTADLPVQTLSFSGAETTRDSFSTQGKVVIARHRAPVDGERRISEWISQANANNWSYTIQSADQAGCGHSNDEVFRVPKQGLSVRFSSATGVVERVTESESRDAH